MFASVCDSDVIQAMWDAYLLDGDQFFVFFLMLVMVLNAKYVKSWEIKNYARGIEGGLE